MQTATLKLPFDPLQVTVGSMRFNDRGTTLIRTIQRLPALVDLVISYDDWRDGELAVARDDDGLPRCQDLAELRSPSLTRLSVSLLGGPAESNTLRLSGLPQLRKCELYGQPNSPLAMDIDAASFQGAPQLQSLGVYNDPELELQDDSLRQLTSLTSLVLKNASWRASLQL